MILKATRPMLTLLVALTLGLAGRQSQAQAQCGLVDAINPPVDTTQFALVQDFSAPSPRHQGRFHTGEDWYGGQNNSLDQPVRAIAKGRVTYAAPSGWGRDGGVIIIEHTLPDESIVYSQYGHIMETSAITFPQKFECVQPGQVIAAVGDARPAPHLHFEIRVNQPDIPGPGYTWEDPLTLGWREPDKFLTNWQTFLQPAHIWHLSVGTMSGPAVNPFKLNDNSLLYADRATLRRATPDGRVLWRVALEKPAAALVGFQGNPLIVYTDGIVQRVDFEGALGESWSANQQLDPHPLALGDGWLFHTPGNTLVALSADLRTVLWQLEDMPPFVRGHLTGQTIGLITPDNEILTISSAGQLLDRAQLRDHAGLATLPDDGALVVYSRGGLWKVDASGQWSAPFAWADQIPPVDGTGAISFDGLARLYAFDGRTLRAYDRESNLLWETLIPDVRGISRLDLTERALLLVSSHGHILAVSAQGAVCGRARLYADDRARLWYDLGADGILRVAVADQFLGLDWARFTRGC